MRRSTIGKAKIDNVFRLAKWLKLQINGMSFRQVVKLIRWRITRNNLSSY